MNPSLSAVVPERDIVPSDSAPFSAVWNAPTASGPAAARAHADERRCPRLARPIHRIGNRVSRAVLILALGAVTASATQEDAAISWPAVGPTRIESAPARAPDTVPMPPVYFPPPEPSLQVVPAGSQPTGALTGRIIFTSAGHGWTWGSSGWYTQRGVTWEMIEDYGNLDQMNLFVDYCFNAGATIVALRPIGYQTNEVVMDNVHPGVTLAGPWSDSASSIYFGAPGALPYRYANLADTETATATYTPTLPAGGFYPVYTWVLAGSNRSWQLYRVRHTGGETTVTIPHHMVGNGWVYLGTYFFEPGSNFLTGAVVISNRRMATNGTVVIADAIRFGNGMGDVDRTGGISSYPREEECARYWVQRSLGQGQSASLYDTAGTDGDDNVGTPPRMAAEMNREAEGNMFKRVYLGFHSNASGLGTNSTARGNVVLYNNESLFPGTSTSNQFRLAQIVATNVNNALNRITVPPFEVGWTNNRASLTYARSDFAFGEIRGDAINWEMDATILEVAFHDNYYDALLMRDPKFRLWTARATYQGLLRYFNEFDAAPLVFLPEPPYNVRAVAVAPGIQLSWNVPIAQFSTGTPTGYVIYLSTNGYGFGQPVMVNGGSTTTVTLTNLAADRDYYFRVAAVNAGGESRPSEVVGCRRASNPMQSRVLVVNAFDRFDRSTNLRQTNRVQGYLAPGPFGNHERVIPRANNAYDYVVAYGRAISAFGLPFDSCARQAVTNGQINLLNYDIVVWAVGQSLTNTFRTLERNAITLFQNAGGHLFVSGADIAWDLDRASGPAPADRAFLRTQLRATLASDTHHNANSYTFTPASGSIFAGNPNGMFDNGWRGIYWVQAPDRLTPTNGSVGALHYVGGLGGPAALQYAGGLFESKLVYFGFPFETITSSAVREAYMADILRFFSKPPRFVHLTVQPDTRLRLTATAEPGLTYTLLATENFTNWVVVTNIVNETGVFEFVASPITSHPQRFYRIQLAP